MADNWQANFTATQIDAIYELLIPEMKKHEFIWKKNVKNSRSLEIYQEIYFTIIPELQLKGKFIVLFV